MYDLHEKQSGRMHVVHVCKLAIQIMFLVTSKHIQSLPMTIQANNTERSRVTNTTPQNLQSGFLNEALSQTHSLRRFRTHSIPHYFESQVFMAYPTAGHASLTCFTFTSSACSLWCQSPSIQNMRTRVHCLQAESRTKKAYPAARSYESSNKCVL